MEKLEILILLLTLLVCLNSVAEKIKFPYPIVLVIAGLLFSMAPNLPNMNMNPQLIFLVFLPPLLYEAANNTSWHEFKKWRAVIMFLAIGLVFFNIVVVAAAAHYFIPEFTWPLGFLLGAIISPSDAVAATSATKGLRLPKHVVVILEGESLVNDASALIAYKYALAAVVSGAIFDFSNATLEFIILAGSGVMIGLVIGFIIATIHRNFDNPTMETTISLLVPFVAYLVAEEFEVSGVLAVVACGLYVAWHSSELFSFETRIKISGFWDILIFLLNGLVFILIGLQLPSITSDSQGYSIYQLIGYGLFISVVTILTRIIWMFLASAVAFKIHNIRNPDNKVKRRRWREIFVLSWAGMRGVVSLATALAIPVSLDSGIPFPARDLILFITFIVILVTLVFQGITLPYIVRKLRVEQPLYKQNEEEVGLRIQLLNSSMDYIETELSKRYPDDIVKELIDACEHRRRYFVATNKADNNHQDDKSFVYLRDFFEGEKAVIVHQYKLLNEAHKNNTHSHEVIKIIQEDLDSFSLVIRSRIDANRRVKH